METITMEKGSFERWMRMIFDRLDRQDKKLDALARRKPAVASPKCRARECMDVRALAEVFNVTANTIYRWKRLGSIPLRKIGGKLRMLEHEVAEIITSPDKMQKLRDSE